MAIAAQLADASQSQGLTSPSQTPSTQALILSARSQDAAFAKKVRVLHLLLPSFLHTSKFSLWLAGHSFPVSLFIPGGFGGGGCGNAGVLHATLGKPETVCFLCGHTGPDD